MTALMARSKSVLVRSTPSSSTLLVFLPPSPQSWKYSALPLPNPETSRCDSQSSPGPNRARPRTYVQPSPVLPPIHPPPRCLPSRDIPVSPAYRPPVSCPNLRARLRYINRPARPSLHCPAPLILCLIPQRTAGGTHTIFRVNRTSARSHRRRGMKHAAQNVARSHSKSSRPSQHAASLVSNRSPPANRTELLRLISICLPVL